MSHAIKIDRARKLSATGAYPATFGAMLAHVSPAVIEAAPARLLATIIDDLARASTAAKEIAIREAIDEGVVWDGQHQVLREIAA